MNSRAGNNSWSSDIVRPNFEYVWPISHYDRTWCPNILPSPWAIVHPWNLVRYDVKQIEIATGMVANAAKILSLATKNPSLVAAENTSAFTDHHYGDYVSLCWWSITVTFSDIMPFKKCRVKDLASLTWNIKKAIYHFTLLAVTTSCKAT